MPLLILPAVPTILIFSEYNVLTYGQTGWKEGTKEMVGRKGRREGTDGRDEQKGRTDGRKEGTDARLPKVKMKMRALIKKQKDVCKMCLDRYHFIIPIYCNNILLVPALVVLEVCKDPHWS